LIKDCTDRGKRIKALPVGSLGGVGEVKEVLHGRQVSPGYLPTVGVNKRLAKSETQRAFTALLG